MVTIEKMTIHIMEPSSDHLILSDLCMTAKEDIADMLQRKVSRLFTSPKKKTGKMKEKNELLELLMRLKQNELSFEEFSKAFTSHLFALKRKYAQYHSVDMMIMMIMYENQRYIVGLENNHTPAYTHQLHPSADATLITVEPCMTLSSSMLKKDAAFIVCLSDFEISTIEEKIEIEAQKRCFYNDIVFHLDAPASYQDAIHTMTKVCDSIIDEYQLESVDVKGKMKQAIKEHMEQEQPILPEQIADVVFETQPLAKKRFTQELKDEGIEQAIAVEHVKQKKADQVQRIKTDKGIELIIPIDYMKTTDYVEIVNEQEGMISIRLKNIHRITSK